MVWRFVAPHLTLFLPHLCVFVHVFICAFLCRLCSVFLFRLSCMRAFAGQNQQEGFLPVLRLSVVTERRIGKTTRPPPQLPPTQNTQVSSTLSTRLNTGILKSWNHTPAPPVILIEMVIPVGPKLYKEPSAKSNKHIIQNALAHCCLAGKVNEGQKNKILDVCKLLFSEI